MKKIIASILISVSLLLCLSGCSLIDFNNDDERLCDNPVPHGLGTVFYDSGRAAFVKVKDFQVLPGVYYDDKANGGRIVLMSCTLVKDYYDVITDAEKIVFKVRLDVCENGEDKYIDPELISQLFSSFTSYFIYLPLPSGEYTTLLSADARFEPAVGKIGISESNVVNNALQITNFDYVFRTASAYHIIPLNGAKVDFEAYDKILLKHGFNELASVGGRSYVSGYEKCFYQGLTESDIAREIIRYREIGYSEYKV